MVRDVPLVVGVEKVGVTDGVNVKVQGNVHNDVKITHSFLEDTGVLQRGDVPMAVAEMRGYVQGRIRR